MLQEGHPACNKISHQQSPKVLYWETFEDLKAAAGAATPSQGYTRDKKIINGHLFERTIDNSEVCYYYK